MSRPHRGRLPPHVPKAPPSPRPLFFLPPRSCVFPDKAALLQGALELAVAIAARSPVAVQGTKVNLLYSRDHPVPDGLRFMVSPPVPPHPTSLLVPIPRSSRPPPRPPGT